MSTIQIGSDTQDLCGFSESWIAQQINRRRKEGEPVCVRVHIKTTGVDVAVATGGCPAGGGGGRLPTDREREILDDWNAKGLNSADFHVGNLMSFLKQTSRFACG
jgi:hypothetical protein